MAKYNLESRTLEFAKNVRIFTKKIRKTINNIDDIKQVIRSSGSVGANYIEANDSLSKKDLIMRLKISKKEAKETTYWLNILDIEPDLFKERDLLIKESREIMNILGSILIKIKN